MVILANIITMIVLVIKIIIIIQVIIKMMIMMITCKSQNCARQAWPSEARNDHSQLAMIPDYTIIFYDDDYDDDDEMVEH